MRDAKIPLDQPERGRLQVWLGYAAGVGKTCAMLGAAHRLLDRGENVVVGFIEPHGRARTSALIEGFEVLPRRLIPYKGTEFEEMDVDAILEREPAIALVDELAHTNVEGSRNAKRWEDVEELLAAGISVLTTLNIQHLESVNDTVERITGVGQRETIPDAVVRSADQIDLVDISPDALLRRLSRGDVYPPEKIDAALANYFREGNLTALRELALLWLADRVDEELLDYMDRHEIRGVWETRERVVATVSGKRSDLHLIRRAARMAARSGGDLLTLHVSPSDGLVSTPAGDLQALVQLTEDLGGTFHEVVGDDVPAALLQFSRAENATQIVMGASSRSRVRQLLRGSVINRVVRESGVIDVHVISQEGPSEVTPLPRVRQRAITVRRQVLAGAAGLGLLLLLAVGLSAVRTQVSLPTVFLLYLCAVVAVASIGGWLPGVGAALLGSLLVNYFFTPPLYQWTIAEPENVVALVVFLMVASVVSWLVDRAARSRIVAGRARSEAEALARLAGFLARETDPLPPLVARLRTTFGVDSVSVLRKDGSAWRVEASSGNEPPQHPDDGEVAGELGNDAVLVLKGGPLSGDDQRVLAAFTAQLAAALHSRSLQAQAASASELADLSELRAALLNAVSHDLRTPLASIKASVTSLRQTDVEWTPEDADSFLKAIEEESDRLDQLVGNLLDMSRLQADAVTLFMRDVGLEEVVINSIHSLPGNVAERVDVEVPESLSAVRTDPPLLERAIANLIDNACKWSSNGERVAVRGSEAAGLVQLRVIDRGPGISESDRDRVFLPFQRLGDHGGYSGVGLGLAVAHGLIEAVGGKIDLEDTPGGGLTVVLTMEAVA